jgi:hypothetical protein
MVAEVADGVADVVERSEGAGLLRAEVLRGAVEVRPVSAPTVNPENGPIERPAPDGISVWRWSPMISTASTSPSTASTAALANPFRTTPFSRHSGNGARPSVAPTRMGYLGRRSLASGRSHRLRCREPANSISSERVECDDMRSHP